MEEIVVELEKIRGSKIMTLEEVVNSILKKSCLQQNCLNNEQLHLIVAPLLYRFDDILNFFQLSEITSNYCSCEIKILQYCYKNITDSNKDVNKGSYVALCELIIAYPDKRYPLTDKYDAVSTDAYELNMRMNPVVMRQCLLFYLHVLYPELEVGDNNLKELTKSSTNVSQLQTYLIKKTTPRLLVTVCSRLGNFEWVNDNLKTLCIDIINLVCACSNAKNISVLLIGDDENGKTFFPNGVFQHLLNEISISFKIDIWKKNLPIKHALVWFLTKVKYPHLGAYIINVVPTLLKLADDYSTENKVLGITIIDYVIQNVNPADLRLYNHADVIYDAFFTQLYSNKDSIYEVLLPCLLKILKVLHSNIDIVEGIKFSRWDLTLEKILQNLDLASSTSTKIIFLKNLPSYINGMAGNVIKHVDRIVSVSILCLEDQSEHVRLLALTVIITTAKVCWPVFSRYQLAILKGIVKLLVDVNTSRELKLESKCKLEDKARKLLQHMRVCSGDSFDKLLLPLTDTNVDRKFLNIHLFIKTVLQKDCKTIEL
ncbi:TELO2-interacting protein 2-like [Hydractinia symbiolongicarpus]|uniref:TELO2-interacting protein 2-like n=1 Tax=Hydractinia symbiolongicarpus TaxID=13093 RepID=UPI00254F32EE|nr:TELO2-interacting protein 2-like [Hydractinia symbiolongicarpus]